MTVAKRELGRTGLQVTTLGYGAMELRGAPRARDISEAQAETILNKVVEVSKQIRRGGEPGGLMQGKDFYPKLRTVLRGIYSRSIA
jgi:hypothetical protein